MSLDAVTRSAAQLDADTNATLDADRLDTIAAEATELNLEVIEYAREHPAAREQLRPLATRLAFIGAHATLKARLVRAAETRQKYPNVLRALMSGVDRRSTFKARATQVATARRRGPSRQHRPVVRRTRRCAARSPGRPQPDDDPSHDVKRALLVGGAR